MKTTNLVCSRALCVPGVAVAILPLLIALIVTHAGATTLTFNELPTQPVDNLSFMGVTFDFKIGGVDSLDAKYGSIGPGAGVFVQDPSLEGNAVGILTLDFATPVSSLQFGVALSTVGTHTPGFIVSTFDASLAPIGVFPITTTQLAVFTEGQFINPGGAPIGRAIVDFEDAAGRFALDNLTFNPVPEPGTFAICALGAVGLLVAARRKR